MSPPDGFLSFHEDERRAQALAGQQAGRAAIRPFMPQQHRDFFALLPYLFTATLDAAGAPLASMLWGPAGFVHSPDPVTLRLSALPGSGDPAASGFAAGNPIGLLGLDLSTRRRNRANGRIVFAGDEGFIVSVEQSFGNCPQYIRPRDLVLDPAATAGAEMLGGFDAAARAQVAATDTFFVGTSSGPGVAGGGADISHRGGPAGFVRVDGDLLTIPDYRGNRYFNTLGNLLLEPRAALLFVDFAAGELLQLQGVAEVLWDEAELPGAERTWRFHVEAGWRRAAGLRQVAVQPPSTESAAPVAAPPTSETR
jgi:hypothetical protein